MGRSNQPKMPSLDLLSNAEPLRDRLETEKTTKADRQEFFLPFTGFAWFYPEEVRIIDHPAFQRLGRINQLGQAVYVYRGATHKRLEHVLGVVALTQRMISAIEFNSEKITSRKWKRGSANSVPLTESEERFVRLAALLHDIGHIAAGHTIEDELELVGKHDADERLTLIFDKKDWSQHTAVGRESLSDLVNRLYRKYLPDSLVGSIDPTDIARLLIRKSPPGDDDKHARERIILDGSADIRREVCANIVANTICADLLDYIHRDWHHVGKSRSFDDRIFQYMEIRSQPSANHAPITELRKPTPPSPHDRFVIALENNGRIRTDGVSAILGLLEWRYELAETVLFHRTKLAAGAMLDRALFELWGRTAEESSQFEQSLVERILMMSDEQLIDGALSDAAINKTGSQSARIILEKLKYRELFKEFEVVQLEALEERPRKTLKQFYAGLDAGRGVGAANRARAARLMEKDLSLPAGSVALYCAIVKPKIAEVSIAVDDVVQKLSDFELENNDKLSGGHLSAQIKRFGRLNKLCVFVDRVTLAGLSEPEKMEMSDYVLNVVLSTDSVDRLERRVSERAELTVQRRAARGANSLRFRPDPADVARNDPSVAETYPNGAPSVWRFIEQN